MSNINSNGLLFTIPVVDVLSFYGKRVDHRGYMYYSPFRDESAPSMRVTVSPKDGTWVWADFGGEPGSGTKVSGGGIIDMVRLLEGLSADTKENRSVAFRRLRDIASSRGYAVIEEESREERRKARRPAGIVLDDVQEGFTRRNLVRYASVERGIPLSLLERYCRQVTYHSVADPSRRFTVIGFPNDGGGYALRGTGSPQRSKRNYLSGVSTFSADGTHAPGASVAGTKCVLFEGFFDFLAWMAWRGVREPGMDACVLNSTANLAQARSWILSHGSVRSFFDNDGAGDRATETLAAWCAEEGKDFRDGRGAYEGVDDVNEAWCAALEKAKELQRCSPAYAVSTGNHQTHIS